MSTLFKDYLRTIKNSLSRFISIALIVAIGAGFYAGLKSAGPDMRLTADTYFEDQALMDLKVMGNYGLDETDLKTIEETSGVEKVSAGYSMDVLEKSKSKNVHLMSIPDLKDGLNIPTLVSGDFPKNENDCVVDSTTLGKVYKIGDEIEFYLKEDDVNIHLNKTKLKVVGTVVSPMYIGNGRGTSTVGNGNSDGYILTSEKLFKSKHFSEVFVKYEPPIESIDYTDYANLDLEDVNTANVERKTHSTFSQQYEEYMKMSLIELEINLMKQRDDRKTRMEEEIESEIKIAKEQLEKAKASQVEHEKGLAEEEKSLASILEMVQISQQDIDNKQVDVDVQNQVIRTKENIVANADDMVREIDEKIRQSEETLLNKMNVILDEEENLKILYQLNVINSPLVVIDIEELEKKIDKIKEDYNISVLENENYKAEQLVEKDKIISASTELVAERAKVLGLEKIVEETIQAHDGREEAIQEANENIATEKSLLKKSKEEIESIELVIEETAKELERLERIHYTLYKRNQNPNYDEYVANSRRIDAIASVFPVFFVLVAALVCLTGMTRLVEEQTSLIGTYKAIGYSNIKIAGKYIFYASTATILGAFVGLLIGFALVPRMVMGAYSRLYTLPKLVAPVRIDYTLIVFAVALLINLLATILAVNKELRASAATLMRPKSPKKGKRILLERIPFLWKAFSFKAKITMRNIFRYKRRMFMTVLGIAGCSALILTGFALRNSLTDIVDLQYGEVFHYDMIVSVDDNLKTADKTELEKIIKDQAESSIYTYQKAGVVKNNQDTAYGEFTDVPEQQASIFVVSEDSKMDEFITLRDRVTKEPIELDEESVILTEKLAEFLNLDVGDQILITIDNNYYISTVKAITENYTNHYVYMGSYIYQQYVPGEIDYTNIMIKAKDSTDEKIDSVAEILNSKEYVRSATLARNEKIEYANMVESLNLIVYLLIGAAALLAFIVLYNLTTINVAERKSELSTVKVLGYLDNEVTAYIGRENIVLTVIGIIAGLVAGVFLARYVVVMAEVESLMFGRQIKIWSFVLAALLTMLFTAIVNFIMHYQLKKVDMLEATKFFD